MATKQEERRIRQSLQQAQLHVKNDQLALERERLRRVREVEQLMAALRALSDSYGLDPWPEQTGVLEVVQHYLLGPISQRLTEAERRAGLAERRLARANAWIEQCLALAQATTDQEAPATRQVPRAVPAPVPRPVPAPLRPTPVPAEQHRAKIVWSEDRGGGRGHRALCICGWTSRIVSTEADALEVADRHASGRIIRYQEAR